MKKHDEALRSEAETLKKKMLETGRLTYPGSGKNARKRLLKLAPMLIDCGPGCSACCRSAHLHIEIRGYEAERIAAHLRQAKLDTPALRRKLEEYAAIQMRVAGAVAAIGSYDPARIYEHYQGDTAELQTPCPFLDTERNRCSVYSVRPYACIAYDSLERSTCEALRRGAEVVVKGLPFEFHPSLKQLRRHLERFPQDERAEHLAPAVLSRLGSNDQVETGELDDGAP